MGASKINKDETASVMIVRSGGQNFEWAGRGEKKYAVRFFTTLHGVLSVCRNFGIRSGAECLWLSTGVLDDDRSRNDNDAFHRRMPVYWWRVARRKFAQHPVFSSRWIAP